MRSDGQNPSQDPRSDLTDTHLRYPLGVCALPVLEDASMCSECNPVLAELDAWIEQITIRMGSEYARIRARATEDPGTAGDEGEEGWAGVLRDWLPSTYEIRTKGRILAHDGKATRQVDLLVLRPGYPRRMLESKMYMASGVAAAFECKLTLKANHLTEAVETGAQIARLCAPRTGTPYRELVSPIVYGVLAHSHSWSDEVAASRKVNEAMAAGRSQVGHAREELDLVCVADACTYLKSVRTIRQLGIDAEGDEDLSTFTGAYVAYAPPAPIGPLIAYLLMRLAWEDPFGRSPSTSGYQTCCANSPAAMALGRKMG